MSADRIDGVVVPPGQGRRLVARAQDVTFKVTGEHARYASTFEVVVPPGFDTGAHLHLRGEEFFYVLEGELTLFAFEPRVRTGDWHEWSSVQGNGPVRAGAGSCMFVPTGCPHAFANLSDAPARMLFQSAPPPEHERYFELLLELFDSADRIDVGAVARLRAGYDVHQITPLRYSLDTLGSRS